MGRKRTCILLSMVMFFSITPSIRATTTNDSIWFLSQVVLDNYNYFNNNKISNFLLQAKEAEKRKKEEIAKPVEPPVEEEPIITISAAGDATLGYYYGQSEWNRFDQVAKQQGHGYFFEKVLPIFKEDDLTIINLEGPLTTGGKRVEKQFAMKGEPAYTEILQKGSVEAVSLANNHSYDYGEEGYKQTKQALDKAGIGYSGEESNFYTEVKGVKVALIGAKGWNNNKTTKEQLQKRIREARAKADLVIIMFHWGIEREFYPNKVQQDLAYLAIDEGADLVLGSHPHVIQGIEKYKGKSIVYSLSNFSFGGNRNPDDKDCFIYQETFKLTPQGIESVGSNVIPSRISSVTHNNNYQPTPLVGQEGDKVLNRLKTYSSKFKESYFK